MNVTISAAHLTGQITPPASKSFAHRQLIAAALSDAPTTLFIDNPSDDITATLACISALGAGISLASDNRTYTVTPITSVPKKVSLFCAESGSTLRFLLPVTAALGTHATFSGSGRLPQRPNRELISAMEKHGICATASLLPLTLSGQLEGGLYEIPGNVSSQYITGLLLALPMLCSDSRILFTTPVESASYLSITCQVLEQFGITVKVLPDGYLIPGNQHYRSVGSLTTEGDWSSAVFWYCANQMGHHITLDGMNLTSCQGDRAVLQQLEMLGSVVDVSQTPDSLPALAVAACTFPGTTRFTGAGRLRIKESDRLSAVYQMLTALGQQAEEFQDELIVHGGKPFIGGTVNGCRDHRIVMAAALAASVSKAPVTITDAEAVSKSYPRFFKHYVDLGGKIHGQYPG